MTFRKRVSLMLWSSASRAERRAVRLCARAEKFDKNKDLAYFCHLCGRRNNECNH